MEIKHKVKVVAINHLQWQVEDERLDLFIEIMDYMYGRDLTKSPE